MAKTYNNHKNDNGNANRNCKLEYCYGNKKS